MEQSEAVAGVLRLANEVHGLAKAAQRPDISGPLAEQAARWKDATTTVVLAGAQKRGKSRLLNSLVGRPDLLPVDADIATHTQVALVHGPALRVTVQRVDGTSTEIDPAALPGYASVLGDPAVLREVAGLEVVLDAPLLDGLRLVDTPGVDSLTLGHRHATMGALATADALLFAVSAQDQPVLRHELEFLAEAAQRVPAVAFVLTKVEDSTSWRDLLRENRDRLARFCGPDGPGLDERVATLLREAPWLPVSAKLGDAALALEAAGHAERAAARRERSGLPALAAPRPPLRRAARGRPGRWRAGPRGRRAARPRRAGAGPGGRRRGGGADRRGQRPPRGGRGGPGGAGGAAPRAAPPRHRPLAARPPDRQPRARPAGRLPAGLRARDR
jgi:hypothetical protein